MAGSRAVDIPIDNSCVSLPPIPADCNIEGGRHNAKRKSASRLSTGRTQTIAPQTTLGRGSQAAMPSRRKTGTMDPTGAHRALELFLIPT